MSKRLSNDEKLAYAKALLWRHGSGPIMLDCNGEGRFTMSVEHAEAQDESFVADSLEGLVRLVIYADKKKPIRKDVHEIPRFLRSGTD